MAPSRSHLFDIDLPDSPGRRRAARWGVVAALLLHALVIGLVLWRGPEFWQLTPSSGTPAPARGGGGGGGGGGTRPNVVYILPPAAKAPVPAPIPPLKPPPPVPPPPVPPARTEVASVVAPSDSVVASTGAIGPGEGPGTGGGAGGGTGGGQGTGTGTGTGPGAGGGEGGSFLPPEWKGGPLPFGQTPKALRGKTVTVTFWVRADGQVERVEMQPPIEDAKFRDYLDEVVMAFRFKPARTPTGEAVPGTIKMDFTLPSK